MTVKLTNRLIQHLRWIFVQYNKPPHLDKTEQERSSLAADHPLVTTTELHNDELDRRRNQLWIGLWSVKLFVLIVTFVVRRIAGEPINPLSILIQVPLYCLVLANFIFMKTRHTPITQGLYVLCIHLAVPTVFVLYGGTRGFGDIALFTAVIVSMLYGWRPWMFVTFGAMSITLIWVLYHDKIIWPRSTWFSLMCRIYRLRPATQHWCRWQILTWTNIL